jgi:uncharacterized protein with HEPN domain
MLLSHLDFLKHIAVEIDFILDKTSGKEQQDVFNDAVLSRAIIRSLEIIGETTKKLPNDFTQNYPEVEWKSMAGTRDRLIHHYFGVDYDIVWDIS